MQPKDGGVNGHTALFDQSLEAAEHVQHVAARLASHLFTRALKQDNSQKLALLGGP